MPYPPKQTSEYLKVGDAARFLGVNRRTIYRRIQRGELPASKVGGLYYIRRADLEALLTPGRLPDTGPLANAGNALKCGLCFRLLESDTQIAEVCAQEGCDALICTACWNAGERYCARHQPDSEEKWQRALRQYQAGEIPVLVRDRSARLQEINFLGRIRARVTRMSTLIHPLTETVLTIQDWAPYFEQGDERAQVMRILNKMVLDAETTARTPPNAWMQWTLPPAKKDDAPLRILVRVRSRLPEMLRDGFDTRPLGEADLSVLLVNLAQEAQETGTPTIALLASTTGWDAPARRVILGEAPGTAFAPGLLLPYLFDLPEGKLIFNPQDDRLRGYAELFTPLSPSEELQEVYRAIEKEMLTYDTLTLQRAAETLPFSRDLLRQTFEKLAESGEYALVTLPDLGLALVAAR